VRNTWTSTSATAAPEVEHRRDAQSDRSFVLDKLETAVSRLPAADVRADRVTLDLTGLLPTPGEMQAFVGDRGRGRRHHAKVVDVSVTSRVSVKGAALARRRPLRDYQRLRGLTASAAVGGGLKVINAFNSNMPFDSSRSNKHSGDLLPDATDQTRLATGCRNHPITIGGGVSSMKVPDRNM
jgi:hypothetical protein